MKWKKNKVKHQLKLSQPVFGFLVCTAEPTLVEIMGMSGFDFVAMDLEHGRFNIESIQNMVRAAENVGLTPLVRIPNGDYDIILPCLESGVLGVIMSHTKTTEEVEQLVQHMKYYPEGKRGFAVNTRGSNYGFLDPIDYFEKANQEIITGIMVEDKEAVESIELISNVNGLDLVFIGPGDLSVAYGHPAEFRHPDILNVIDQIIDECLKKREISIGMFADDFDDIEKWLKKGITFISYLSEVDLFSQACKSAVERFNKIKKTVDI